MKKRYKIYGYSDFPVSVVTPKEIATSKKFDSHLVIPEDGPEHHLYFTGAMVRSGPNKNMAWFDQVELFKASNTIKYNAVDIDHEQDKNCGAILDHVFVNVENGEKLSLEWAKGLSEDELRKYMMDAVILGVLWEDRYPMYADILINRRTSLSMETFFSTFLIRLDNGTMFTIEEAQAYGLSEFIDRLFGSFSSEEEFKRCHTLNVTLANAQKTEMLVYKYLKDLSFSGVAYTQTPACNTCNLIATNRDECECQDELQMAASSVVQELPSLDLRQVDSYMKKIRDNKEIPAMNIQVAETIIPEETAQVAEAVTTAEDTVVETAVVESTVDPDVTLETAEEIDTIRDAPPTMVPPPSSSTSTPNDITSHSAQCPQYRYQEEISCLFANATCEAAGDRKDKSCRRWFKDEKGVWKFDSRNNITDDEEIVVNENLEDPGMLDEETAKRKHLAWLSKKIESLEFSLESFRLEREVAQSKLSETAATWTTQYINGLPNSSFAVVESGYKDGDNKNARHLPFKDGGGKVDLPHLRNALARANQIKNVLGKDSDADLRARAQRKLAPYAKRYLKTNKEG